MLCRVRYIIHVSGNCEAVASFEVRWHMPEHKLNSKAFYHLPGLYEFYELYKIFVPLFYEHKDFFYDWCEIGSIYGSPEDCLWGGGRVENGYEDTEKVKNLLEHYGISPRLTFSNSLLSKEHLSDGKCNRLCRRFTDSSAFRTGAIVSSDMLIDYLNEKYPSIYLVSSTTKVIKDEKGLVRELQNEKFTYVVPDHEFNRRMDIWAQLSADLRSKVEFLCNECCPVECRQRKACYEAVSRKNLGLDGPEHHCPMVAKEGGYSFARAMKNQSFISIKDIADVLIPMGYSNFKIEGRGLGSAMVLEMLIYYMVKPEYSVNVREAVYLSNTLDLF